MNAPFDLYFLVMRAVSRRAEALGLADAVAADSFEVLGDELTAMRPSTTATRALACDAWLIGEQRYEAVAWAMADREGFADLDAWVASECAAQGVQVRP